MPTFTGNLRDLGLDPRPGMQAYLRCALENAAGYIGSGNLIAGAKEFYPDASGNVTLIIATTVGMVPRTRVKLTGGWLGEDSYFDLPPFDVPDVDGKLSDLVSAVAGNDIVYTSATAPDRGVYTGFQFNTTTQILHKRRDS